MIDYLRHPNGRGKLFDDAEANRATFIDRTSSASGSAKLRDCNLYSSSLVSDSAQVYGGEFHSSHVAGTTIVAGSPFVSSSLLRCSEVSGGPTLDHVIAYGITEICDRPQIRNVTLMDAIVYGNPTIEGGSNVTLTGRIHEGHWTRAPKHVKLGWCDLSECVDGKMLLNCYCRPVEWFLRFGRRLAAKWDWSEDMIEITLATIRNEFYSVPHGSIGISSDAGRLAYHG